MFSGQRGLITIFIQLVPYGNEILSGLLPLIWFQYSYFPLQSEHFEHCDDVIEAVSESL